MTKAEKEGGHEGRKDNEKTPDSSAAKNDLMSSTPGRERLTVKVAVKTRM